MARKPDVKKWENNTASFIGKANENFVGSWKGTTEFVLLNAIDWAIGKRLVEKKKILKKLEVVLYIEKKV
jgi:hypothetical protein